MAGVESAAQTTTEMDPAQRRKMMIRAVVSSAAGTAIEWYDFFLYGVASSLVFPPRFFPSRTPTSPPAVVLDLLRRLPLAPLRAALFGHFGDRIGRKAALIATLLLMGVSTMAIGLVPGYETIGIWGAALLTFFRVLQGIGVGGEWGGAVLMAGEWTDPTARLHHQLRAVRGARRSRLANGALALMSYHCARKRSSPGDGACRSSDSSSSSSAWIRSASSRRRSSQS